MNDLYKVIRKPIITERGTDLKMLYNKVIFSVCVSSNKREIKKAVEKIFNVTVLKVNTVNQIGKVKRFARKQGRRPSWKKATITLKQGDKIDILEGV
jgi:large subunit ribosomal protein L23